MSQTKRGRGSTIIKDWMFACFISSKLRSMDDLKQANKKRQLPLVTAQLGPFPSAHELRPFLLVAVSPAGTKPNPQSISNKNIFLISDLPIKIQKYSALYIWEKLQMGKNYFWRKIAHTQLGARSPKRPVFSFGF